MADNADMEQGFGSPEMNSLPVVVQPSEIPRKYTEKRSTQRYLRTRIALAICACVTVVIYAPGPRALILRTLGNALVADDPVTRADAIVIAIDTDGAGALEAADLFHSKVAPRVAIFVDSSDATVAEEFSRRGIPYEGGTAPYIRELEALGIKNLERIPGYVAGTTDEGPVLATWCAQQHLQDVVVVSTSDHSRRLRRVLRRHLQGHSTNIQIRSARYSTFKPDQWWQSHGGVRTELEELEKLLLDVLRHPAS